MHSSRPHLFEATAVPRAGAPGGRTHVAFLIHTVAHGGVDTIVINWIHAIDKSRFEVFLVCFQDKDTGREKAFTDSAAQAGIEVHYIPWSRHKPFFLAARRMAKFIRDHRIDILHCYNTYADVTGVLVKSLTGVKIITTMWVWGHPGWKRKILQWVDRLLFPFFDQVSAQSEATLRDTVQLGLPAEKIKLLICGYHDEPVELSGGERARRRSELGAGPDDVVLANVARFWPEKGHEILLEGFRLIHNQRAQTQLWLVGSGPDEPRIRELAGRLGVMGAVRFLGFRRDLPELLALADIQVHPSHAEGVPLALCAGMAAGLPIVATRVGGVPEILDHDRTGILVEPKHAGAFASAVLDLIAKPARRAELGQAARRFIQEEYSLDAATRRLEAVYSEMMAS